MIVFLLICAGCLESPSTENSDSKFYVTRYEIRTGDDKHLLHIDDLPPKITVDKKSKFGATTHFTGVSAAPGKNWVAITTMGTSHGAGWLLDLDNKSKNTVPAAFQYGGSIFIGPWSKNAQFLVFAAEGPAPVTTFFVVNLNNLGNTVHQNARSVRLPEHKESIPPETHYRPIKWCKSNLIFKVNDEFYSYDAFTSNITSFEQ